MRALGLASATAVGIAFLALSASGGCGGDAFSSGSSADSSTGDGSSSGGGDDGMPGEGGDGPAMVAGHTVYVAPSGKDTDSGLDPQHAVRTIKKGVEIAQGLFEGGVMVPNVLVCSGNYPEDSLHVNFDLGLFGAYDCTTNPSMWTRAPAYGWPTFDARVASVVTFANTTMQTSTLAIDGSVTSSTKVDGLVITGQETVSATGPSLGIEVALGASPVLSNLVVSGGSGSAGSTDAGSIGVRIGKDSNPEIKNDVIDGGSGKGPAGSGFGSIGVRVLAGAPNIHDDVIAGGSGQSIGFASVGVDVLSSLTTAGNNPLSKVIVVGADAGPTAMGATVGVAVRSAGQADLDMVDSVVYGTGNTTGTVESVGVEFDDGGKLTLLADRIAAGANAQGKTVGVQVTSAESASIVDCEIHGGDVPGGASGSTRGILLTGPVSKAAIVFDTIYTGAQGGQSGTAAIDIEGGVGSVTVENDLLFGNDTGGTTGSAGAAVIAGTCSGGASQLAALDYTGFVNFADLLYCNDLGTSSALPSGITVNVEGPTTCKKTCGNVVVTGTCATPSPSCQTDPACPSMTPPGCVQSILGSSWSSVGDGIGSAGADAGISSPAWQIEPPGNYCKLTSGGVPYTGVMNDLVGHARSTTKPTMGAVEYMGGTCTN
ncbi:MAG TPA: hypothetical protein VF765_22910 [Polyangiaceae bacterium]